MNPPKPVPKTNSKTEAEFWERLTEGDLPLQTCSDCGSVSFPPLLRCPNCYAKDWEYTPAEGTGTVYSYTVIRRPSSKEFDPPIVSVIVELDEGPRVMGIIDCEPKEIALDDRVEMDPSNLSQDDVRVVFKFT